MSFSNLLSQRAVPASDASGRSRRLPGPARRTDPVRRPSVDTSALNPILARGSLALVLVATAALYIVGLSKSGWANAFYSAAAQAGSKSWEALFYGSLDAGNSITVDKPPAAMWVMGLSVRIFGLSSWSILVPEALMGVAAVATLYFAVRRSLGFDKARGLFAPTMRGHWAALAGAVIFALTPAATLMFRFNNPDALLVLLETLASYCVIRATERASRRWLVLAGVAIGFGFLTKMLQAFLVLPAFVVAYAICAPASWKKKIVDLLAAFGAMIVSAGWYVAVVELVPASMRPYIGGSQTNSFLELVFGYNGLGRLNGDETGSVGGGGGGATGGGMWGSTGVLRLFESVSGGMVTWLVPAAAVLAVFAFIILGRRSLANAVRNDGASGRTQAASGLIVYLGWLVVTFLTFSFMAGIFHDYYDVALAPAIGGAVAIAGAVLWMHRDRLLARVGMAVSEAITVVWAVRLLMRAGGTYTVLGGVAAVVGTIAALAILFADRLPRLVASTALGLAFAAALAGPASYSLQTASTAHTGSIVTAGPVSEGGPGGRGGMGGGTAGGRGGFTPPTGTGMTPPGQTGGTTGATGQTGGTTGTTGQTGGGMTQMGGAGGMGGLLNGATVSSDMTALLAADASKYTWVAATVGSQNSASYQLATGDAVMAIGGFNGSDPSPTLAQFKQLVAEGKIHYFIGGGSMGSSTGGSDAASEIASWVSSTFTAQTVGGVTVYDLTSAS